MTPKACGMPDRQALVEKYPTMNKRERFLAFARFREVDRVPRRAIYTESLRDTMRQRLGEDPMTYFDSDQPNYCAMKAPADYVAPDYSCYFPEFKNDENFHIDANGCGHKSGGFHHFTQYISPLRNASSFDEIQNFPYVDKTNWSDEEITSVCATAHANGETAIAFVGHMYESAWQVRGYQAFLMDLLTEREWAEFILDKKKVNNLRTARAAAHAGCDAIHAGDDVANQNGMMFQPDLWRALMKPRWAEVFTAAREIKQDILISYHSDGNITAIIDDLVEIGVNILNPVQPECMNPVTVRKRYGKRLAFDGCIGTQTTFPFAKPEELKRVVNNLARDLDAKNGGLMLSPTHILEPDVPPENIVAFFNACDALQSPATRCQSGI